MICPAVTNVSLLASAMSFPAFIAAIVGRIPIIPTIAVTTTEHCSCVAASNNPSIPAHTFIFVSARRSFNSSAFCSLYTATITG